MDVSLSFWGSQGRIGKIRSGPWSGRSVFIYPDSMPEWWTLVIFPSPYTGAPGDMYFNGTESVSEMIDEWDVDWLEAGSPEEIEIEKREIGWRPLGSSNEWLVD